MNDEHCRLQIARACGWKNITRASELDPDIPRTWYWKGEHKLGYAGEIPDYFRDLNAMASAEETLSVEQECDYIRALAGIMARKHGKGVGLMYSFRASACDRAEAFLIVFNKLKSE